MIKMLDKNELDMDALEIKDIIDTKLLQKFQDDFAFAMNCASVTVDKNGKAVTNPSSYTKFCNDLIHSTKKGDDRCAASHKRMGEEARRTGKPFVGVCHAGLIDFAAPIIIEGSLIGTVLGGQMLNIAPKEHDFIQIAKEIDVHGDSLVEAVHQVNIVDMKNIEAAANVLFLVVNSLAKNGHNEIKLDILSKRLSDNFMQVSATVEELSASATNIASQQEELNSEVTQVGVVTEQINGILDAIKSIAAQTKMLGLNASIEAARAGELGKGFSVVAKEIRNLAENSKETAKSISELTTKIQESVNGTIKNSKITLETTKEQSNAMEAVNENIQDSLYIVDQLNNMMENLK
ncbi:PocR ligand-binding domain-containing protein [Clostridium uliginosum]|uniref:Ligand-binding sensor domain-containing protein n=1 Tax=Clostridium uliginosum TaxID=119641 RepID=A0A1I1N844_9CLOT|nr:PocR ligand-binding domain-containing protein [Clostridium uliginosum]SFC93777.1 Ligand-binding sensor domain-containing protein [Clostridium uliginosum]